MQATSWKFWLTPRSTGTEEEMGHRSHRPGNCHPALPAPLPQETSAASVVPLWQEASSELHSWMLRVPQLDVNDACWQVIEAETQLRLGTPLPLHLGNPTLWFLSWFSDLFFMIFHSSLALRALDSKRGKGPRLGRLTIK